MYYNLLRLQSIVYAGIDILIFSIFVGLALVLFFFIFEIFNIGLLSLKKHE